MQTPSTRSGPRRARSFLAAALSVALTTSILTALTVVLPMRIPAQGAAGRIPPTTGQFVPVDLIRLVPASHAGNVRTAPRGGVVPSRPLTLLPTVVCSTAPFTAMGIVWNQQGGGEVAAVVQTAPDRARFGRATRLTAEGDDAPDAGSPEDHPGQASTSLYWIGSARCSRLTFSLPAGASVGNVRAVFVNSAGVSPMERSLGSSGGVWGAAPAEAATTKPWIITRKQWGADEKLRNCGPYYMETPVKMAFIHHTANPNSYTKSQSDDLVRAIYWYHTKGLGWCDIAYNFIVDRFGQIFEGRYGGMTAPVLPGATKGFNTGSFAISALGTFSTATPPAAMVASIKRLLAWRMDWAHVPPIGRVWMYSRGSTGGKYPEGKWVQFNRIGGHRDAGYTSCPGNKLYAQLGGMRTAAYAIGLPKIFLPAESPTSMIAGDQTTVTWTAYASEKLSWHIQVLDPQGQVIRSWNRWGLTLNLSWDALDGSGQALTEGAYSVKIWGTKEGTSALAATMAFDVLPVPPPPSPSPSPSPSPTNSPSPSP